MKLLRELTYQCLILVVIAGLIFVAADLSNPKGALFELPDNQVPLKVFSPQSRLLDDKSSELENVNTDRFKNVFIPFLIYMLACGGFIILILDNLRLLKYLNPLCDAKRRLLILWVIVLGLMCLLPVYLGSSMIYEGLWYMFIIIAVSLLFYWMYWSSKNV